VDQRKLAINSYFIFSKKSTFNRDLKRHFKLVQEADYSSWKGLNIKFIGRPGQTNFLLQDDN